MERIRDEKGPRMPDRKYLELLSEKFPTAQSAYTEIINLEAILNLPKGTEHFVSDVHGEYDAFKHILNNCSGVIRERVQATFRFELTHDEQADLCTLIYYPHRKLRRLKASGVVSAEWYAITLMRLVRLARYLSDSYTRSKVRKAMPVEYAYIIDELLHAAPGEGEQRQRYHQRIIDTIVDTGSADDFIVSLASLIKRLAVDHLHLVGDVFDRGAHADKILDRLMEYHSVDLQWGNHDIVWMGAAAGSATCLAAVIRNNIRYDSLKILESAYGVSLRELALFAEATYAADDAMTPMEKAISVILFKLEGQTIQRHPNWHMEDRLLLGRVDPARGVCVVGDGEYELVSSDFPTLDPSDPYALSDDEVRVMDNLLEAVRTSYKLQAHVNFLYDRGSAYLVHNDDVLFHACVPMNEDGTFHPVNHQGSSSPARPTTTTRTASPGAPGTSTTRSRSTGCGTCGAGATRRCPAAWSRPSSGPTSRTARPGPSRATPTTPSRTTPRSAGASLRSSASTPTAATSSTATRRSTPPTARRPCGPAATS